VGKHLTDSIAEVSDLSSKEGVNGGILFGEKEGSHKGKGDFNRGGPGKLPSHYEAEGAKMLTKTGATLLAPFFKENTKTALSFEFLAQMVEGSQCPNCEVPKVDISICKLFPHLTLLEVHVLTLAFSQSKFAKPETDSSSKNNKTLLWMRTFFLNRSFDEGLKLLFTRYIEFLVDGGFVHIKQSDVAAVVGQLAKTYAFVHKLVPSPASQMAHWNVLKNPRSNAAFVIALNTFKLRLADLPPTEISATGERANCERSDRVVSESMTCTYP